MHFSEVNKRPFTNNIFILSLACSLGGVLISTLAAQLSMPVFGWISFYLGLTGFAVLFTLLLLAASVDLARGLRKPRNAEPGI